MYQSNSYQERERAAREAWLAKAPPAHADQWRKAVDQREKAEQALRHQDYFKPKR